MINKKVKNNIVAAVILNYLGINCSNYQYHLKNMVAGPDFKDTNTSIKQTLNKIVGEYTPIIKMK